MLDLVDDSFIMFRTLRIWSMFYVDDVIIETVGAVGTVQLKCSAANTYTIKYFQEKLDLEVSAKKSGVLTAKPSLTEKIVGMDSTGKLQALKTGKVLGVVGSGGARRCTVGQEERLASTKARVPRVHAMRRAGVCATHMAQSSFSAAMLYDACCHGVSDSMLKRIRITSADGLAPPTRGKHHEMVLYAADAAGTRIDPAFDAHALPIKFWALAWWQGWRTHDELELAHAQAVDKLTKTRGPLWQAVAGPPSAVIATAWRIGWTFKSGRKMVTETGREIDCLLDSPVAIVSYVCASVRRWRLGRILKLSLP